MLDNAYSVIISTWMSIEGHRRLIEVIPNAMREWWEIKAERRLQHPKHFFKLWDLGSLTATIVVLVLYANYSSENDNNLQQLLVVDRIITYLLLVGALILEIHAFISLGDMLPVGAGLITLHDTVIETVELFERIKVVPQEDNIAEACRTLLLQYHVRDDASATFVLFHACEIAKELIGGNTSEMWQFVAEL
ncbi:hypothetical protein SESBI_37797 [Sesbania bispinosa]|nr:hypothetical protein SESBI_37797 [Sesbania bispinosa]